MERTAHGPEPHASGLASRLNWLRAGVLGANDGIVSTAALVVGVAAATPQLPTVLTAGFAGLIAGAVSMALGEYVSVSAQRDTERALIKLEREELANDPVAELRELELIYEEKGLSPETAKAVAKELTEHDVLTAHLEAELGITEQEVTTPWHAALASAVAFTVGALIPLIALMTVPQPWRIAALAISTVAALAITGSLSAWLGAGDPLRSSLRVVIGGLLALALTFTIGSIFGVAVG